MIIEEYRKARMKLFAQKSDLISIDITEEWRPFGVVEGDEAKLVRCEDGLLFFYRTSGPGKFPNHYHEESAESGICLKGSFTYTDYQGKHHCKKGDVLKIEKGIAHTFVFLEATELMLFYPDFDTQWKAS